MRMVQVELGALSPRWYATHLTETANLVMIIKMHTDEAGYGEATKLMYIQWIGERISPVEVAHARQIFPSVYAFVHHVTPLTGEIEARTHAEVTRDALLCRVRCIYKKLSI